MKNGGICTECCITVGSEFGGVSLWHFLGFGQSLFTHVCFTVVKVGSGYDFCICNLQSIVSCMPVLGKEHHFPSILL